MSSSEDSEELLLIGNDIEDILQKYQEESMHFTENHENIQSTLIDNFKKENLSTHKENKENSQDLDMSACKDCAKVSIINLSVHESANSPEKEEQIDINIIYDKKIHDDPNNDNDIINENEEIILNPNDFASECKQSEIVSIPPQITDESKKKNNSMGSNNCPCLNYSNPNYLGTGQFIERFCHNHTLANLLEWQRPFEWDLIVENVNLRAFGYKNFRPNQREIINASLCGRDIFVCMPSGGGKSLTFQIPALVSDGVTLVVMPLLSLIQDQVSFLSGLGMKIIFLNAEGMNDIEKNYDTYFFSQDEAEHCKLIFVTPEKIAQSQRTMTLLKNIYHANKLCRVVIDEAHCVSQWGREFRPDYLNLRILKIEFPGIPILATTATATNKIREDIITQLRMQDTIFFRSSYNRSNLYIEIRNKKEVSDIIQNIADFIKRKYPQSTGLIYCTSKKECEKVAEKLRTLYGLNAEFYHASMCEQRKNEIQDKWKNDEIKIIVATVAFGMGINKSDVRYVIHHSIPKSFEGYYQEIGRAGRDGNMSHCILYYSPSDRRTIEYLMSKTNMAKAVLIENFRKMTEMIEYCEESSECRRVIALLYFDEKFDRKDCGKMCDNCRKGFETQEKDVTEESVIILNFLHSCYKDGCELSISTLIDYLRGLKIKLPINKRYHLDAFNKYFGNLTNLSSIVVKKIIRRLIILKFIDEYLVTTKLDNVFTQLNISNEGIDYIKNKDKRIIITFPKFSSKIIDESAKPLERTKILFDKKKKNMTHEHDDMNRNNSNPRRYIPTKGNNEEIKEEKERGISMPREDYGYCTKSQFEELLDKLKIKRREILKEENRKLEMESSNGVFKALGADDIFPLTGLMDLCRKLPSSEQEINTNYIFGVGAKTLSKYGRAFLPEIIKHANLYEITKKSAENFQEIVNESESLVNNIKTKPIVIGGSKNKNKNKSYVKDNFTGNENVNENVNDNDIDIIFSYLNNEKNQINFDSLDNEAMFNSMTEQRPQGKKMVENLNFSSDDDDQEELNNFSQKVSDMKTNKNPEIKKKRRRGSIDSDSEEPNNEDTSPQRKCILKQINNFRKNKKNKFL